MPFPTRHKMVAGTFLLALIVLFDRIMISVAKDPVAADLGLSDKEMGWVLAIFALGYALFQAPAGAAADRFGPRKVLTAVVSLWSIFTALTGAAWGFISLLVVRFIFGVGEAGAFPSMARAIYSWIPLGERGIVNGINFSGGRIGAAIALPVVAVLIDNFGWRMSFVILGAVGVLWAIGWYWWFRDEPADHNSVPAAELAYIQENVEEKVTTPGPGISTGQLFGSGNMWLLMGQYFGSNFTFFFTLTWLFPYLKSTYSLDFADTGFYAAAPLLAGALGNWASGFLVDALYKRTSLSLSRKIPAMIGFTLAAVGVLASVAQADVTLAVVWLSIAVFGADMTLSPSWAACVDIGRRSAGTVSGTMNMAGNLGSFFTALAFPYLVEGFGSAQPFFYVAAALSALAIVLWFFVDLSQPIIAAPQTEQL
ncbi:MFS transporter [Lewinella sp. 4G2]|uniref:MFS transporter n=1 Tax=Lewinella sp. 4G2 TaxID=1803372 RepID=UPI0007B4E382|nr:MFS transporter [Lewinella sp. 4G2]OAV43368.1 MFS transporter [Lewinella sp. 4G2]